MTLRSIIAIQAEMAEELPLVHTSKCEFLLDFMNCGQIIPRYCEVFNECLVYFFYGRPAYRSKQGHDPGESIELCPICLVFEPRTVSQIIARVFPCDTGALHKGMFRPYFESKNISELELDPVIESARRYIKLLFKTNADYFVGKADQPVSIPNCEIGEQLGRLLLASGPTLFDDRKSAVEVQTRNAVSLKDQLLYIVLPSEFLDDLEVREAIQAWNCKPVPYHTVDGDAPAVYHAVIREELYGLYARSTLI